MSGWRPAQALRRAVLLGLLLPAGAVVTGRVELLVLGAPLLVGTVLALLAGPRIGPSGDAAPRARAVGVPATAGQGRRLAVRVDVDLPDGAAVGFVRVPREESVPFGEVRAVEAAGRTTTVVADVRLARWGRVVVARPDLAVVGPDALLVHEVLEGPEARVLVAPAVDRAVPAPLPPRTGGVVGVHRTRRPGEGSDLLDVREFRPGDRMRRVDWRVTARRGSLHVRRTAVDAESDVVLAVDTRLDVGPAVRTWTTEAGDGVGATVPGTSLDRTVRTAASLAASFLAQGDRVSVVDLSRPRLSCPPGTGRRHLRRVLGRLADARVVDGATRIVLRPGAVPVGALVLVVSPFLDDAAAELVTRLLARGNQVVAVDALPPVDPAQRTRRDAAAARLVLAEQRARLATLRRAGAAVSPADGAAVARGLRDAARRRQRVGR